MQTVSLGTKHKLRALLLAADAGDWQAIEYQLFGVNEDVAQAMVGWIAAAMLENVEYVPVIKKSTVLLMANAVINTPDPKLAVKAALLCMILDKDANELPSRTEDGSEAR